MKILFAAPDRDLLECYKRLLEPETGVVVTAFDGTQVFSLLSEESFDTVILDRRLPRIDSKTILTRIREKKIPVIVLTGTPAGVRQLTDDPLPNAYLTYPFTPEKMKETLRETAEAVSSEETLDVCGTEVCVTGFRFSGGPGLTLDEINVLKVFSEGGAVSAEKGVCISALNAKFAAMGSKIKIRYRTGKGFEPVKEDD